MFIINDDKSIYITRGDAALFAVTAMLDGVPYEFQPNDVVRFKVFEKKGCDTVVLQKDFPVIEACDSVDISLVRADTKIGDIIHKPKDFWYEVELNPDTYPQTIIGYDEDGAKSFRLLPEGKDLEPSPDEEEQGTGVYERMMVLAGEMHGYVTEANKASKAAVAASETAVKDSAEAKALAQSVRDDADNGVFKGDRGERGAKGDTGRGYDGNKIVKEIASGTTPATVPVVIAIPNATVAENILITASFKYVSGNSQGRSTGAVYHGQWNGGYETDWHPVYEDTNGDGYDEQVSQWWSKHPDTTGLIPLYNYPYEKSSGVSGLELEIFKGAARVDGGNFINDESIGAGETDYITIVPYRRWDTDEVPSTELTYAVYVVERESSGEGDTAVEELVHEGIEDYLAENGLTAQAVVDADVLQAALGEVLK